MGKRAVGRGHRFLPFFALYTWRKTISRAPFGESFAYLTLS